MEQKNNLNLARKWRPQNFNEIVGQEVSIKMLLNSLYLGQLFPVYLFAGQRGCGKTSTARVFGAAINCTNLNNFRSEPQKNNIPCQECNSCKSTKIGNHPDFIEIDAASHTGVENVRQILESCSYMPILGNKKIYLIDEAHMLSKAAFNAFLKILEEPPSSALFILATTEIQKFPATVLSRCFQIIFKPVSNNNLKKHIKKICTNESISIEDSAIDILIQETEGSVRDSINMLERVRFSETKITTDSVAKTLGKISESEILSLFEIIIKQDAKELIDKFNSKVFEDINPSILWNMLIQTLRAALWLKFKASKLPSYFNDVARLEKTASQASLNRLNAIFQLFWSQEDIFLKTPNKKILLETVLLQACQQVNILDIQELLKKKETSKINPELKKDYISSAEKIENKAKEHSSLHKNETINTAPKKIVSNQEDNWQAFLNKLGKLGNPFIISILSQSKFIKFNINTKYVEINLLNNNSFTKDAIIEHKKEWLPLLKESYPKAINLDFKQNLSAPNQKSTNHTNVYSENTNKNINYSNNYNNNAKASKNSFDLLNKEKWPKANLVLKFFPGKIKKI